MGSIKDAKRAVRRVTNAWRASVVGQAPDWMRRSLGPPVKYFDMLFVDHGIFRVVYVNRHQLSPAVWRSRSRRRTTSGGSRARASAPSSTCAANACAAASGSRSRRARVTASRSST